MENNKLSIINKLSFLSLIVTFFISIFFFLPYSKVPLEASKGLIISVGTTISLFFWLVARLVDGKFTIPKDRFMLFTFAIPFVYLISSFFSSSINLSLFGRSFEIDTFVSMLIFSLILFLTSVYFQNEIRIRTFFKAILVGSAILGIIELLSMIINLNKYIPGAFNSVSFGNLFGTWNDFAILFGGIIVLSVIALEFGKLSKRNTILVSLLTFLGLFMLVLVNNMFVWMITEFFVLIVFVYSISSFRSQVESLAVDSATPVNKEKSLPAMAFVVVIVCLVFIIGNNSIGSLLPNYFNISSTEISPSLNATLQIAKKSIIHNPFTGTGPNTFPINWSMWKSTDILKTQLWNVDFPVGYSSLFTSMTTVGVLGIIAWFLFFITFIRRGLFAIAFTFKNTSSNYFIFGSFILALYFWVNLIFSNVNLILFALAFAFTGLFFGVLTYKKIVPVYDNSFLRDPRASFFSIFLLVVFMIASVFATLMYAGKFVSLSYYTKATSQGSTLPELNIADRSVNTAISFNKNDVFYRLLSQIHLAQMNAIVSDKSISEDTVKSNLQSLVTQSITASKQAIDQNPKYYINWINLGNIYTSLLSLGVTEGSYDNAIVSYDKALSYSADSISVLLSKAQLEIVNKNNAGARVIIKQALEKKPDYLDAIFTLAQIEINEGNSSEAEKLAERAATYAPNDSNVFFKLGTIRYNSNNFNGAVSAFENSVILDNNNLNARYFLSLAYQKLGRVNDAKIQLELLKQILPENTDIDKAMESLKNNNTTVAPVSDTNTAKKTLPEKKQ